VARQRARVGVNVNSTVHSSAKRSNIPTAELEAFAEQDEKQPGTLLYPRDPSLDPQLVWKGKDDQDRADLAVPVVPIYIQEKIHPRYLIEQLRAEKSRTDVEAQIDLFNDFNGLEFEQLVEFYQHSMRGLPGLPADKYLDGHRGHSESIGPEGLRGSDGDNCCRAMSAYDD
jgi:adenine-specific DNA-methyltransferase